MITAAIRGFVGLLVLGFAFGAMVGLIFVGAYLPIHAITWLLGLE